MKERTENSKAEPNSSQQEKLDPCLTPPSHEAKRTDKDEDACDDGVK